MLSVCWQFIEAMLMLKVWESDLYVLTCPCNLIVEKQRKGKGNAMKGIIYGVYSSISQSTFSETRRCPIFLRFNGKLPLAS